MQQHSGSSACGFVSADDAALLTSEHALAEQVLSSSPTQVSHRHRRLVVIAALAEAVITFAAAALSVTGAASTDTAALACLNSTGSLEAGTCLGVRHGGGEARQCQEEGRCDAEKVHVDGCWYVGLLRCGVKLLLILFKNFFSTQNSLYLPLCLLRHHVQCTPPRPSSCVLGERKITNAAKVLIY